MAQVYVGHPCPYCGNTGYKPTRRFKPLFWLLVILTCGGFWVIDALFQWFFRAGWPTESVCTKCNNHFVRRSTF